MGYLLGREAPHAVFLPSVWPETWCYTLSHAIASGLPVAAFDIGAMGERLRQESGGTLFPMGLPPREINRCLIELGREAMGADNSAIKTAMPASVERTRGSAMSEWNRRSNG
jgi:glycosyltransferase involved in cell wall biosynthesis